jgi:hypothetical protein
MGTMRVPQTQGGRVGIKKPTQKTHPKKPKKTTKNGFFGFLNFFIFYENNTNFLFQTDFL